MFSCVRSVRSLPVCVRAAFGSHTGGCQASHRALYDGTRGRAVLEIRTHDALRRRLRFSRRRPLLQLRHGRFLAPGWARMDVVRGRAKFWVSVSDWVSFMIAFQSQDRSIYRQVLPLSEEQVANLAEALALGALPENREYIYSHFLDNCATRPRDLIDGAAHGHSAARRSRASAPIATMRGKGSPRFTGRWCPASI